MAIESESLTAEETHIKQLGTVVWSVIEHRTIMPTRCLVFLSEGDLYLPLGKPSLLFHLGRSEERILYSGREERVSDIYLLMINRLSYPKHSAICSIIDCPSFITLLFLAATEPYFPGAP